MIWSFRSLTAVTQRKTEEERQLADGRGEGEGTESYIGEKAWSSKTHLVLSVSAPIHSLHFVISTGPAIESKFLVPDWGI